MSARPWVMLAMAMLAVGFAFWWVREPAPRVGPGVNGWSRAGESARVGDRREEAGRLVRSATTAAAYSPMEVDSGAAELADPLFGEVDWAEGVSIDIGEPLEPMELEAAAAIMAEEAPIDIDEPLDPDDPLGSDSYDLSLPDAEPDDFLDPDDLSSSQVDGPAGPGVEIGAPLDADAPAGY